MQTKKEPVIEEFFGHELTDNYRWLENAEDPEVLGWVEEENRQTDRWFDEEELTQRIKKLKAAEPSERLISITKCKDGYIAMAKKEGVPEVIHLDRHLKNRQTIFARYDIEHITPHGVSVSSYDDRYIAISSVKDGDNVPAYIAADRTTKNVVKIIDSAWDAAWSLENEILYGSHAYYDEKSKLTTLKIISYHMLSGEEKTVYEECGTAGLAMLHMVTDKEHILVEIWDDFSNCRYVEIDEKSGKTAVINTEPAQITYAGIIGDEYYFISKDLSENGTLVAVQKGKTLEEARIVREGNGDMLEEGFVLKGSLYLLGKRNAASILLKVEEGCETEIALPDAVGTASFLSCSGEEAVIHFESFSRPRSILSFDGESFETLFVTEGEQYDDIVVEQRWAPSKGDGTMIPYFLVHRADARMCGRNPVLIYAYGGYNFPVNPWYQETVTGIVVGDWVRKGGIYVLANLRGGNEFGSRWHKDGMLMKKRNCYDDFIAVTEQLIQDKWTRPDKIAINGCSNGGLLMSALVTMRPDLFGCVIDSVPHTDMIRFALDDNGSRYIQEYGDPMESREMFEYMLSYSPYHNVRETEYPAVYIQTGECDNNVPPYHGKKFAAAMQEKNQSVHPVLLRVLPEGAHDRGSGEAYFRTISEMQLFIEKSLNIE